MTRNDKFRTFLINLDPEPNPAPEPEKASDPTLKTMILRVIHKDFSMYEGTVIYDDFDICMHQTHFSFQKSLIWKIRAG
jgi:hypothetical protein